MVGGGWCSQVRTSSELQFGALREVWRHARTRNTVAESLVASALSGGYAPDPAKAEGSSIIDKPGEC